MPEWGGGGRGYGKLVAYTGLDHISNYIKVHGSQISHCLRRIHKCEGEEYSEHDDGRLELEVSMFSR